jgi:regulator of replication initiation timing
MSEAGKPEAEKDVAAKSDRKRLTYLKTRLKALKEEMQAVRKESVELRQKLGKEKKGQAEGGAKKAGKKKKASAPDGE